MGVAYGIYQGVNIFLQIIEIVLVVYCLLSWFVSPLNRVMQFLARLMDPLLAPIRRVLFSIFPRLPIDLSVLVLFLLISLVRSLAGRILMLFF